MVVGTAGIVTGVLAAVALSKALLGMLLLVALALCTLPAIRASGVNPMVALRLE
jgi:hypothetical protein